MHKIKINVKFDNQHRIRRTQIKREREKKKVTALFNYERTFDSGIFGISTTYYP